LVATLLASAIGYVAAGAKHQRVTEAPYVIAQAVRLGADGAPQVVIEDHGKQSAGGRGALAPFGSSVQTDARTRIVLSGAAQRVSLDRSSSIEIGKTPVLTSGTAVVESDGDSGKVSLRTKDGWVRGVGAKLLVTALADRTSIQLMRGSATVECVGRSAPLGAGQEAVIQKGELDIVPATDMGSRVAFGEVALARNEDADAPVSGVGELRAKKPGSTEEKDKAVRLARHDARVRIVDGVARTEIEEVFENVTDDVLEGIYRFPLPAGAQMERLALDVDGKMVEGEFVDRTRAAAIWRGAIANATPKTPRPKDEIVWVPGPWHDPALLEWKRGGRFELKIFPIPKHGSRKVILAYTENLPLSGANRRYTYPLPETSSSKLSVDQFHFDVRVLGSDTARPVSVRGYELSKGAEGQFEGHFNQFVPSGDLVVEFDTARKNAEMVSVGYTDTTTSVPAHYATLSLRPKLPKWMDASARDHVIVVDTGRAMFGERLSRAKRLAVQLVQDLDRRDRVTVLACDLACRSLPQGLVTPGSGAAHDVDAFLSKVQADGATDLSAAVEAGLRALPDTADRESRMVLISAGFTQAGPRSPESLAQATREALGTRRAPVNVVPVGSDADDQALVEIARATGGVRISYAPGEPLARAATEVLAASYGRALRDVEVQLPPDLADVAPKAMPALRPGSELLVSARMLKDHVQGEVILRGKVGGEVFEARYPLDVTAQATNANAFVARGYAAQRVMDLEREPSDIGRKELVDLSRRFSVPSKHTSLLVLESEAMFKAFGIARADHVESWTGNEDVRGAAEFKKADGAGDKDKDKEAEGQGLSEARMDSPMGASAAGASAGRAGPAPAAKAAAPLADAFDDGPARAPSQPAATASPRWSPPPAEEPSWGRRRRPAMIPMRRIWVHQATVQSSLQAAELETKLSQAKDALLASPDERNKHRDVARLLARLGRVQDLDDALVSWGRRDPLDRDLTAMRASVVARRGDRTEALRIMSGALSAPGLSDNDEFELVQTTAQAHERSGAPAACAFRVAAADMRPKDVEAVALAVQCERGRGRRSLENRWLRDGQLRTRVDQRLAKSAAEAALAGAIQVRAAWESDAGVDVDIVLIDPQGRRLSCASAHKGIVCRGATSSAAEQLSISTQETGRYSIEVVRAGGRGTARGKLHIGAFGAAADLPFVLDQDRVALGTLDVRLVPQLVPIEDVGGWDPRW
jgi:hypothetical protein